MKLETIDTLINESKSDLTATRKAQKHLTVETSPDTVNTGRVHMEGTKSAWMLIPKEVAKQNDKDFKTWKAMTRLEDDLIRARRIRANAVK